MAKVWHPIKINRIMVLVTCSSSLVASDYSCKVVSKMSQTFGHGQQPSKISHVCHIILGKTLEVKGVYF